MASRPVGERRDPLLALPVVIDLTYFAAVPFVLATAEPMLLRPMRPNPERNSWSEACELDAYEIEPFIDTPADDSVTRGTHVWVRRRSDRGLGLLTMPGCSIRDMGHKLDDFLTSRPFGTVGGGAIFVKSNGAAEVEQWWFMARPGTESIPVERPPGIVSFSDAEWQTSLIGRFRRTADGWVAWGDSRGRSSVIWSLANRAERQMLPSGTRINSIGLSPNGQYLAVGTQGDFEGSSQAAAYVIETATKREVFRKFFPRRSFVEVALLGNDYFALSSESEHFGKVENFRILRIRN